VGTSGNGNGNGHRFGHADDRTETAATIAELRQRLEVLGESAEATDEEVEALRGEIDALEARAKEVRRKLDAVSA
jgi:phage shock protein A